MTDQEASPEWESFEMLVVSTNGRYRLLRGNERIHAILAHDDTLPWPIGLLHVESHWDLERVMGEGASFEGCFIINPSYIEGFRSNNRLVDIFL
ncbi:MAG: hypothetical protein ACFBRM_08635 [Pikeienuella sp.]